MTPSERAKLVQHIEFCDVIEYAVMRVLIDIMGDDLRAYITNPQMQEALKISRNTVRRACRSLCERGVIARVDGGYDLIELVRASMCSGSSKQESDA